MSSARKEEKMKYCGYCGAKLKNDMSFCCACGKATTPNVPVKKKEEDTSRLADLSHKFSVVGLLVFLPLCIVGIILAIKDKFRHRDSIEGFIIGMLGLTIWPIIALLFLC